MTAVETAIAQALTAVASALADVAQALAHIGPDTDPEILAALTQEVGKISARMAIIASAATA